MHVISNLSDEPEMMSDDPHSRILAIEQQIDELRDYAERCRKAMQMSRGAIVAGTLLFLGAITGLIGGHNAIPVIGGFAAMIGGFVWLGANKSSSEQAIAELTRVQAERIRAIDALGLHRLN